MIAHFDLDAFYVACERELNPPALIGVPVAVCQYNPHGDLRDRRSSDLERRLIVRPSGGAGSAAAPPSPDANGSLIAVSYEARAAGVRRNDRGLEAARKCPDLRIVQVPVRHGKTDLTMYRDASRRIMTAMASSVRGCGVSPEAARRVRVEKASIDELYVDLTAPALEMAVEVLQERDRIISGRRNGGVAEVMQSEWGDGTTMIGGECGSTLSSVVENAGSRWDCVLKSASHTTVGGVETQTDAALAANGLSKSDLRRGSKLQVLDSSADAGAVDAGSRLWWRRDLALWTNVEISLACGAAIVARSRKAVSDHFRIGGTTGQGLAVGCNNVFTLSGGISTNKTLAKLASGLKKPNRQTLVNPSDGRALTALFHPLPVGRIRGLGGKFGQTMSERLGIATVGDLARIPLSEIEREFPPSPQDTAPVARHLFDISRGICVDEVSDRMAPKSVACSKTFRRELAIDLKDMKSLRMWIGKLCGELTERLEIDHTENCRHPGLLVVFIHMSDRSGSVSRSVKAPKIMNAFTDAAVTLVGKLIDSNSSCQEATNIVGMGVSATSFVDVANGSSSIKAAFNRGLTQLEPNEDTQKRQSEHASPHGRNKQHNPSPLRRLWERKSTAEQETSQNDSEQTEKGHTGSQQSPCNFGLKSSTSTSKKKQGKVPEDGAAVEESSLPHATDTPIDPDIWSQLPVSIHSDTWSTRILGSPGKQPSPLISKNHGIEHWMISHARAQQTVSNKDKELCTNTRNGGKRLNSLDHFFTPSNFNVTMGIDKKPSSLPTSPSNLSWEEIDPDVLNELPPDMRIAILQEMQGNKTLKRNKGIKAFFNTK